MNNQWSLPFALFLPPSYCPTAHITLHYSLGYPLPLVMDKGTAWGAAGRQAGSNCGTTGMTGRVSLLATGCMPCQAAGGKDSGGLRGTLVWQQHTKQSPLHKNDRLSASVNALFLEMWWAKGLRVTNKQKAYRNRRRTNKYVHRRTPTDLIKLPSAVKKHVHLY